MADAPALVFDEAIELRPGLVRVLTANPSAMTGPGTNTYLIGTDELIAIDPGPDDHPEHIEYLRSLVGDRLRYILYTHHHSDHAPAATALAKATGALVLGYRHRLAPPVDNTIIDGDGFTVPGFELEVLHTPGHSTDSCCYLLHVDGQNGGKDAPVLFAGDHMFGGSTVSIGPPDGDMTAYFASLRRVLEIEPPPAFIGPGHGQIITDARGTIEQYIAHRLGREAQVVDALRAHSGRAKPVDLIPTIYGDDLAEGLKQGARSNVWAHLRKLGDEHIVTTDDRDDVEAYWTFV
jgi:glyoxylase-like metal-dependent hydrolase (beta-lactamase superfamily II)